VLGDPDGDHMHMGTMAPFSHLYFDEQSSVQPFLSNSIQTPSINERILPRDQAVHLMQERSEAMHNAIASRDTMVPRSTNLHLREPAMSRH
jgi:hypothetical protein